MKKPVIGISCYVEPAKWGAWDIQAAVLPFAYVTSVTEAGGRAVIIPPDSTGSEVVENLDGLIIAGGADVDAALYSESAHETADKPRVERDKSEILLYQKALELKKPFLGICRGLQIMAVASGGSLIQHLPEVSSLSHRPAPAQFVEHGARFEAGSLVEKLLGKEMIVNSSHHQAVKTPGSLKITGWAEDDTIEVLENPDHKFVIGVQWHPEMHHDKRLFEALIAHSAKA
ncbi:MAG: gamma-glutamyl-gamma-aminobutyrate hydrolase family protein [Candidatus Nanopelagicales bacterium]